MLLNISMFPLSPHLVARNSQKDTRAVAVTVLQTRRLVRGPLPGPALQGASAPPSPDPCRAQSRLCPGPPAQPPPHRHSQMAVARWACGRTAPWEAPARGRPLRCHVTRPLHGDPGAPNHRPGPSERRRTEFRDSGRLPGLSRAPPPPPRRLPLPVAPSHRPSPSPSLLLSPALLTTPSGPGYQHILFISNKL